jgi:hypothetical protein
MWRSDQMTLPAYECGASLGAYLGAARDEFEATSDVMGTVRMTLGVVTDIYRR